MGTALRERSDDDVALFGLVAEAASVDVLGKASRKSVAVDDLAEWSVPLLHGLRDAVTVVRKRKPAWKVSASDPLMAPTYGGANFFFFEAIAWYGR